MSAPALALAQRLSADHFVSGEDLAEELGCSRAAVWKHIAALRELGVSLEAEPGKGYRLLEPLELLNKHRVREAMGDAADCLAALDIVEVTGSTNADLLGRPQGAADRAALLAERQTGGRGRRGRRWVSPFARNLYLSLGWRFETGLGELGMLPLVVAVAVARAVARLGAKDFGLKWPNDVITSRGKLGGCLVEVQGDLGGPCRAVLGVGLNVRLTGAPGVEAIDQAWDDLVAQVPGVSRNVAAGTLLAALVEAVDSFERQGFAPFEADWRHFDRLSGRNVEVMIERGGEATAEQGRCEGLGPRGGLLLSRNGTTVEHLAGEARLRPGALETGQK